ncbi:MAG TPA: hypothetical protein VLS25_02660 [Dehalococcoidia bacterium]|nr:hypothetical protein [Dehalococcoidia bacterium]
MAAALGGAVYAIGPAGSAGAEDHGGHGGAHGTRASIERTENGVQFRQDMRKLWEDHITWTRLFIVSFAADLPDQGPTADRLLQNQTDIGNAIKPFYGDAAGNELTQLLREHILGAVTLLQAAKAGDTAAFDQAKAAWYANGDEIAAFMHNANPDNWPLEETQHHMKMHLDLTLQEAADRLGGNFQADIADYDQVHNAILDMADFLSLGIIHQFPQQFK